MDTLEEIVKVYRIEDEELKLVPPELIDYTGVPKVHLIVEDSKLRNNLFSTAKTKLNSDYLVVSANSVPAAQNQLEMCAKQSPEAILYAVLDYDMSLNINEDERNPTETLFENPTFQKYLERGAIIVFYTGHKKNVQESSLINQARQKYDKSLILVTDKSDSDVVPMDKLYTMISNYNLENVARLKKLFTPFKYDIGAAMRREKPKD